MYHFAIVPKFYFESNYFKMSVHDLKNVLNTIPTNK